MTELIWFRPGATVEDCRHVAPPSVLTQTVETRAAASVSPLAVTEKTSDAGTAGTRVHCAPAGAAKTTRANTAHAETLIGMPRMATRMPGSPSGLPECRAPFFRNSWPTGGRARTG